MQDKILLITPPFTQLNTPYPATAYLKGFLNTKNIASYQADLGIEVMLSIFSKKGLIAVFEKAQAFEAPSDNMQRILKLKDTYIHTIDAVISFLQGKNPTLAHRIAQRNFLPEAQRFDQLEDLNWAFGAMGIQDKAKYIATMYLEDLADLIKETVDPYFGFSRYAEKIGRSAQEMDALYAALLGPLSFVDEYLIALLKEK
ncbi:MAG: radical SAM protein, partial [Chitinophagia bacterium]|nr:radical SAM protein [Chitinophagia bacterium]